MKISVKQGPNGKVTALWPGSSLHYLQVLAEDRWEDYNWEYERERYAYWGSGVGWIEDPEGDPLGEDTSESWKMSTVPRPGGDLAFYLVESEPLPKGVMPAFTSVNILSQDAVMQKAEDSNRDDRLGLTENKEMAVTVSMDLSPTTVAV